MIDPNNKYTTKQKKFFSEEASKWSLRDRDYVVGSFDKHNTWDDYANFLWRDIPSLDSKVVLDFACGPGRNLVRWYQHCKRIDGIDISPVNLEKAKIYLKESGLEVENFTLYESDGTSLELIPSEAYDVVMSTIALQHIAVYEIRFNILKDMYRVLRPGGKITIQMGFGVNPHWGVGYYSNAYEIADGNWIDTRVDDPQEIADDLFLIGFRDFRYYIRPSVPGDGHPNAIFFNAEKP